MNVIEQIDEILVAFAKVVNQKIIDDDFKIIKRSEYTVEILIDDINVEMWTASGVNCFRCYAIIHKGIYKIDFPRHEIKKPATCYKKLLQLSEKEKQLRKKELEKKIAKLEKSIGDLK